MSILNNKELKDKMGIGNKMGNGFDMESSKHLCTLKFTTDIFASDWGHCDKMSNYIARALSFGKPDPFVFGNLLSTVINEILELIFWNHAKNGLIVIDLYNQGNNTIIQVKIPVDDDLVSFYHRVLSLKKLSRKQISDMYCEKMMAKGELTRDIGFYELFADYGADMDIKYLSGDNSLTLFVNVDLDTLLEEWTL